MAQAPQNVWNNSWGSQTNRESTPPAGWTWDFGKNYWEYTGVIPTTPAAPTNTAIYQTSSVDCFPDVVVNTSGDHRICMSAAILSLATGIKTKINNFETVFSSAPSFFKNNEISRS